jgi:hypothetical protein
VTPSITQSITPTKSVIPDVTPSISNTPSICTFPSNNLIAYWDFEEASGIVLDCVGNYSGITTSVTYGVAGILGNAFSYNGTTSKLTVGLGGLGFPKPTTGFTVSFWIKTTDATSNKKILFALNSSYGMQIYYAGVGTGLISLLMGDGTNTKEGILSTKVNTGNWMHCVFTFDGTNFLGYVNNSNCLTTTWSYDINWTNVTNWTFMANNYGSQYVNGTLDEFGVWGKALSPSEIALLYNNGKALAYCRECSFDVVISVINN